MEKITGYVYSVETKEVVAEITGNQKDVETYVEENYDSESCGLTYSPAFGFEDGLIDVIDEDKEFVILYL